MARHNKKRNSGLLYEFLIRKISRSLVEGDNTNANISKSIIKKYFAAGTELHKEYRLINAMVNVPVGSEVVASAVLQEARNAALRFDSKALKIEKDNLIKEINHTFGQQAVYTESVPQYKSYATASMLIKYWRQEKDLDVNTVVKYEKLIFESLSREKEEIKSEEVNPDIDSLVVKVATDKLKRKYESNLNSLQSEIINLYAIEENKEVLCQKINLICESTAKSLEEYADTQNDYFIKRAKGVIENIKDLNVDDLTDSVVSKALEVVELNENLKGVKEWNS